MASTAGAPLVVFALAILVHGVGLVVGLPSLALVTKPIPAFALAWWTLGAPRSALVTAGLCFSALGDIVLDLGADSPFFLSGMAAFAVTHALYIAAFVRRSLRPNLLVLAAFLVWGLSLLRVLWPGLGSLAIPVSVYAALLVAMMWRATAASLATGGWDACLGAVLFGVSDGLIAVGRFHAPVPAAPLLIMASYWAGQFGIARSVFAEGRGSEVEA